MVPPTRAAEPPTQFLVWFPGNALFYSMPPELQLPVANCIGCFWALMCVRIAKHSGVKH